MDAGHGAAEAQQAKIAARRHAEVALEITLELADGDTGAPSDGRYARLLQERGGEGRDRDGRERFDQPLDDFTKLTFYGMPQAQGRTAFELAQDGQPGLTFYNVEHDYPQRIRYWREGEELVAEVALADGSKARRWRYKRMGN